MLKRIFIKEGLKMNTSKMSIKQASIAFDKFIEEGGIGAALFFVLLELIAVNTSSLWYVFGFDGWYNAIWSTVGALGFSIVTTVVIRKKVPLWLKFSFPVFDMLLVFTGMNINHWGHMLDNPLRLTVTIIFSLFTGPVLVALGLINYEEQKRDSKLKLLQQKNEDLESKLILSKETSKLLESELSIERGNFLELEQRYSDLESNLAEKEVLESELEYRGKLLVEAESNFSDLESKFNKQQELLANLKGNYDESFEVYKEAYYLRERARIKKMKVSNWTTEDEAIFNYSERYVKK